MDSALSSLTSELPANLLLTLVIVPILQWAKRQPMIAFINERTVFAVSGLVAFLAAVGIHFTYDPTAGDLHISGLTVSSVLTGLGEWVKQFNAQHWGHRLYRFLELARAAPVQPDQTGR